LWSQIYITFSWKATWKLVMDASHRITVGWVGALLNIGRGIGDHVWIVREASYRGGVRERWGGKSIARGWLGVEWVGDGRCRYSGEPR
jgi:hypothetical protein